MWQKYPSNVSRERSGDAPRRWYRAHNDPHAPKNSSAVTPPSPRSSSLNEPPEPSEGTPKVEGECLCHRRRHLISRPVKFTPLFCRPNDADQIWPSLPQKRTKFKTDSRTGLPYGIQSVVRQRIRRSASLRPLLRPQVRFPRGNGRTNSSLFVDC